MHEFFTAHRHDPYTAPWRVFARAHVTNMRRDDNRIRSDLVEAIKALRSAHGYTLRDAKDAVEEYIATLTVTATPVESTRTIELADGSHLLLESCDGGTKVSHIARRDLGTVYEPDELLRLVARAVEEITFRNSQPRG